MPAAITVCETVNKYTSSLLMAWRYGGNFQAVIIFCVYVFFTSVTKQPGHRCLFQCEVGRRGQSVVNANTIIHTSPN
jgi:hypothetical protein